MRIYLDSSLVNEQTIPLLQFVEGVTFNQKIIKNEGSDYYTVIDKFANEYDKEVSVQFPLSYNLMKDYKTAKDLWELNKENLVIKIPFCLYGVQLYNRIKKDLKDIRINCTMIWRFEQLVYASALKPYLISIFDHSANHQEQDALVKSKFWEYFKHLLYNTDQKIVIGQIKDLDTAKQYLRDYANTNLIITLKPALLSAIVKSFSDEITEVEKQWSAYYYGGNV